MANGNGNEPVARFRVGFLSAAVLRNENFYNVTLTKSYKDDGQWRDTHSLGHGDLANAMLVLGRAEVWISEQQ